MFEEIEGIKPFVKEKDFVGELKLAIITSRFKDEWYMLTRESDLPSGEVYDDNGDRCSVHLFDIRVLSERNNIILQDIDNSSLMYGMYSLPLTERSFDKLTGAVKTVSCYTEDTLREVMDTLFEFDITLPDGTSYF